MMVTTKIPTPTAPHNPVVGDDLLDQLELVERWAAASLRTGRPMTMHPIVMGGLVRRVRERLGTPAATPALHAAGE